MKRFILSFFAIILLSSVVFLNQLEDEMDRPLLLDNKVFYTVEAGQSFNRFTQNLREKGWLDNRFWLRVYVRLNSEYSTIKQGTYLVSPEDTVLSLLKKVVRGDEHQFSIRFIEGTKLTQWMDDIAAHEFIEKTGYLNSIERISQSLSIDKENPEGWFFPDTYAYTAGARDIDILRRAHQAMVKRLNREWLNRADGLPYKSAYEALIMASIIEKETGKLSEQGEIAAVFINRLRKGMRLQTDPTVIYGLGERYQGNITKLHLREKTAYNTYRINGLPPTPIAMPGASAINAALNPETNDYYYFVSKGDGSHQFSRTLAEHNAAVNKYQLGN